MKNKNNASVGMFAKQTSRGNIMTSNHLSLSAMHNFFLRFCQTPQTWERCLRIFAEETMMSTRQGDFRVSKSLGFSWQYE